MCMYVHVVQSDARRVANVYNSRVEVVRVLKGTLQLRDKIGVVLLAPHLRWTHRHMYTQS